MKRTNCANCGAPKDVEKTICPYCGTRYINLLNLGNCEDIYVQFPMPNGEIVTKRAYVCEKDFEYIPLYSEPYRNERGMLVRDRGRMTVSGSLKFLLYESFQNNPPLP